MNKDDDLSATNLPTDNLPTDNLPTDIAEQAIVRQARLLDKEIEPEHDLWPAIAERIQSLPQQNTVNSSYNRWMPMSLAASLLITVGALAFAGYTNYSMQQQLRTTAAEEESTALPSADLLIEQPYLVARTNIITRIATEEQQM